MFAQRRGMTQDDIDDKSRYADLEADNTALLNKLEQLETSAKYHTKRRQEQWNKGLARYYSRDRASSPPRKVTVPDRNHQPHRSPGVTAKANMLQTSGADRKPENQPIVDHCTPGWTRANLVRVPFENVMQVDATKEEPDHSGIMLDTGSEGSAEMVLICRHGVLEEE